MSTRQYRSTVEAKSLLMPSGMAATSGADTMTLNNTTTVPSSFPFTMVIDPDTSAEEIVTVISLASGSTYNVYRGQDGTSAQAHDNGAVVKHMVTARDLQETQNHIEASSAYSINNPGDDTGVSASTITKTVHGIASGEGAVVGTLKTQTLTNKTLTTPTINTPKINENVALTATSTELNVLDGITASTAELNILDGVTASTTELNYVDGVTSAIQTQLNAKASTSSLSSHESDTTSIHGISDTSKLAVFGSSNAGRTIFVQSTQPTALAIGDIWIDY